MTDIIYDNYNKRSVAVRGNKDKYQNAMKGIGAKWNPRMKDGPGWILPKENEPELQRLIKSFKKMSKLEELSTHAKSRKEQHKYHREISESENENESESERDSESEDEDEGDIPPLVAKLLESERTLEEEKKEYKFRYQPVNNRPREYSRSSREYNRSEETNHSSRSRQSNDPIDYYKSFNQKPISFREIHKPSLDNNEDVYSSSNDSRSNYSSDHFPSPRTPIKKSSKHNSKDYGSLLAQIDSMDKRMKEMERESRSRR